MRNSLADDFVFILIEFNYIYHISNYSNSVLLLHILLLQLYLVFLMFNQKNEGTFNGLQKKIKKIQHTITFLSSREHPKAFSCCDTPTITLSHYSLFLPFCLTQKALQLLFQFYFFFFFFFSSLFIDGLPNDFQSMFYVQLSRKSVTKI